MIDISSYLPLKCNWYSKNGYDEFSKPKYIVYETIPCWFAGGEKLVTDNEGNDLVAMGTILTNKEILIDDKVDFNKKFYKVINYSDSLDVDGTLALRTLYVNESSKV